MALVGRSPSTRGRSVARSLGLGVRASRAWPCGRSSPVALRRSLGEGTGSLFGRMSSALAPNAAASAATRNVRFIVLSKGKGRAQPVLSRSGGLLALLLLALGQAGVGRAGARRALLRRALGLDAALRARRRAAGRRATRG